MNMTQLPPMIPKGITLKVSFACPPPTKLSFWQKLFGASCPVCGIPLPWKRRWGSFDLFVECESCMQATKHMAAQIMQAEDERILKAMNEAVQNE